MPPSAMTGMSAFRPASAASSTAVNCGTPTPATMRVVQIEPGPMPTLIASAPASISACAPSRVATLPAMIATLLVARRSRRTCESTDSEWPCAVSTTRHVDPRRHQPLSALETLVADGRRRRDAQAAFGVLGGVGVGGRLLDVLDRHETDAAMEFVDDDELLDAVLVQKPPRLFLADALADGDDFARHQFGDRLTRVGGEAHVAVGEDADQRARLAVRPPVDDGDAGNAVALHQRQRVGERRVGEDGDGIDHDAAFVALDLAHLLRLLVVAEIAVDDADAAGLGHRDGEAAFRHRIHRRGDDRQIEPNGASEPSGDVDVAWQHHRVSRPQQHVVEREALSDFEYALRRHVRLD